VGLAYLRSYLAGHGVTADVCDLNIAARDELRRAAVAGPAAASRLALVDELFLQARRSYLGEAATWGWHDPEGAPAIVDRIAAHPSPPLRAFWRGVGVQRIVDDPDTVALDEHLRRWLTDAVDRLAGGPWRFFGLTLTVSNQAAAFYAARLLRERRPDALVVAGGPHVNGRNAGGLLRACPAIDAAVAAPAFRPLLDLVTATDGRAVPPGVVRWVDGEVVDGGPAADVELDELPCPDWSGVDLRRYVPSFDVTRAWGEEVAERRTLPLQTSRGCSYGKCEFCHNVVDYPRLMARSPARVRDDVAELHDRLGVRSFFFTDDEFNASRRRCIELARALRTGPVIRFFAWLRLDKIDEHLLDELYAAGCRQVFVGVEAVDDDLLGHLAKGYSAAVALDRLRRLHRFADAHPDFSYFYNLIIDHPHEQVASIEHTLATVEGEPELFAGRVAALCRYHLYEGTPAFGRFGAGAPGVLEPLTPPGVEVDSFRPDAAHRLDLWRRVGEVLSTGPGTSPVMAHTVDDSIYD
jgi:hypothetical protein